jgi:cell division protein FtsW (lipid II flippase)
MIVFDKPSLWQRAWPLLRGFDLLLLVAVFMLAGMGLTAMYSSGFDHGTRFVDHGRNMLIAAGIMQALALAGETAILGMDGSMPPAAQETIRRFILFDGGGLILLLVSFFICERIRKQYCGTTE